MSNFAERLNVPLGLFSGPAIVLSFFTLISILGTRPFDWAGELPLILFQMLWISIPFVVVMLQRPKSIWPWLTTSGLNVALYVYVIYDASVANEDRGANIGLGLFMFVSPLLITVASLFVVGLTRDRRLS